MMRVVARLSRGAAAAHGANAGPAQATTHYNKMYTYPADSDQITTIEALRDFASWRPWGNTNAPGANLRPIPPSLG